MRHLLIELLKIILRLAVPGTLAFLLACGGRGASPAVVTPTPAAPTLAGAEAQHSAAVANFISQHPTQALTVTGVIDQGGGIMGDVADGKTNYQHWQAAVGWQDASQLHGTVMISLEDGIVAPGLYQTTVRLPRVVGVTEAANPNGFVGFTFPPFCGANGVAINIVGYDSTAPGNSGQSISAFSLIDPPAVYSPPERHFDSPMYVDTVVMNVSTDLCGFVTVKPTVTMRF